MTLSYDTPLREGYETHMWRLLSRPVSRSPMSRTTRSVRERLASSRECPTQRSTLARRSELPARCLNAEWGLTRGDL